MRRCIAPILQLLAVPAFRNLWLGMLVSSAGSFLLSLALSVTAYTGTRSALLAGSIFSVQWIMPLLAASRIAGLFRRYDLRTVAIGAEIAGLTVTVMIAVTTSAGMTALFALLMVRGLFEAISKSARSVAVRTTLPAQLLRPGAAFFATGYYLGGMFGAGLGVLLLGMLSIEEIAAVDAISFIVAALLYRALPARRSATLPGITRASSWAVCFDQLARNSRLFVVFWMLMLTAALFQGFMTIARSALPVDRWQGDSVVAAAAQFVAGVAILLGALLPTLEPSSGRIDRHINAWFAMTALFMIGAAWAPSLWLGLPGYFVFVALFEVCFTKYQRDVIVLVPEAALPDVSAIMNTLMMGLMTLVVTLTGLAAQNTGLPLLALGVASAALAGAAVTHLAAHHLIVHRETSPCPGP